MKGPPIRTENFPSFPKYPILKPSEKYNDETHRSEPLENGRRLSLSPEDKEYSNFPED